MVAAMSLICPVALAFLCEKSVSEVAAVKLPAAFPPEGALRNLLTMTGCMQGGAAGAADDLSAHRASLQ